MRMLRSKCVVTRIDRIRRYDGSVKVRGNSIGKNKIQESRMRWFGQLYRRIRRYEDSVVSWKTNREFGNHWNEGKR